MNLDPNMNPERSVQIPFSLAVLSSRQSEASLAPARPHQVSLAPAAFKRFKGEAPRGQDMSGVRAGSLQCALQIIANLYKMKK